MQTRQSLAYPSLTFGKTESPSSPVLPAVLLKKILPKKAKQNKTKNMRPPAYVSRDIDHSECKGMHLFVVTNLGEGRKIFD